MFRLFEFNDNRVSLATDSLKVIPEFNYILTLKYNTREGDATGIKRHQATKIFTYIYYMYDIRSPYSSIAEDKERHKKAAKDSGLGINFKPNNKEKQAIVKFKELSEYTYPEIKLLKSLKDSMEISDKFISLTNKKMLNLLEKVETVDLNELQDEDQAESILNVLSVVTSSIKEEINFVMPFIDKVKKGIQSINEIEKELMKQFKEDTVAKGGHQIGNRADPR